MNAQKIINSCDTKKKVSWKETYKKFDVELKKEFEVKYGNTV